MSKKLIFCLLLGLIYAQDAVAFNTTTYTDSLRTAWDVANLNKLKTDNSFHCKGEVTDALNDGTFDYKKRMQSRKHIKLYLAREIYKNGAYFCATWVTGHKNYWDGHAYIKYIDAQPEDCFYACEKGYYGEGCTSTSSTTCLTSDRVEKLSKIPVNTTKIENYTLHGYNTPVNVTDNVAGFYDFMKSCYRGHGSGLYDFRYLNGDRNQQHHVALMVTTPPVWTQTDSYVQASALKARPVIIRAGTIRSITNIKTDAWVRIDKDSGVGREKTLFLDGTKYDEGKNLYVVDKESDVCKIDALCSATPKGQYKSDIHEIIAADKHNDANCENKSVFRCKSGAFKAAGDYSCVPCNENIRKGPNSAGVCTECPVGKKHNKNTNSCVDAETVLKTEMMFGKQNSASTSLDAQCWAKDYKQDYIDCIKNISKD